MKHFLILLLFVILVTMPVFAQKMEIDQLVAFSLKESMAIKAAEDTLLQAQKELGNVFSLDRSRLSLSSDMKIRELNPGETVWDLLSGSVQLSVPVVPQLSIGAALDAKGVSASVLWSPFASPKVTSKTEENYYKAVISLQSLKLDTAFKAENTFLAMMAAEQHLLYAEAYYELVKEQHEITKLLYEAGVLAYVDLEESSQNVSNRRQAMYNAQRSFLEKTRDSNILLGPSFSTVSVAALSLEDLIERIERRVREVEAVQNKLAYSSAVERLQVELNALETQLQQTMTWKPDVSLSVKGGITADSKSNLTVQASVSFSPSDLNYSVKQDLEASIAKKRSEIQMEQYVLSLEQEVRFKTMAIARQSFDAALFDLQQLLIQEKEAKILLSWGDRTKLEVRQIELGVFNARNQSFQQAAAYLKSIHEYLLLFR